MLQCFKHIALILLLFCVFDANAQQFGQKLEGRVYSQDKDVAATHVSNITTNKGTITDLNGFFKIAVSINDTLVFSAVQYKRKMVVVSPEVYETDLLWVPLEPSLILLDEAIVRPYNLSGDLKRDMGNMKIEPVITAATLGLPNAYVKQKTQNERRLFEADEGKFIYFGRYKLDTLFEPTVEINLNKILNRLTGRTQRLKKYVAIDREIVLLQKINSMYPDSVIVQELKIPEIRIRDFMNYCEVDTSFNDVVETNDVLKIWEFLRENSIIYRKNNELD